MQPQAQPGAEVYEGVWLELLKATMNVIERALVRVSATGVRLVLRAREKNGWYGAANVVMGGVSLCFGLVLLLVWLIF